VKTRRLPSLTPVNTNRCHDLGLYLESAVVARQCRVKDSMALKLDFSRTEGIAVVRCRGRIVFGEEADELRRVTLGLLNETQRIVLNLARVEYIDSSGLGALVASFISARHVELKSNLLPYLRTFGTC